MRLKLISLCFIILFFCLCLQVNLYSLDVGMLFKIENISFDPDREESDHNFNGLNFPWGFSLFATHEIGDNFSISSGFSKDSILRYISSTMVSYRYNFLSIGLGPYFGLLNSLDPLIRSGINTSLRIDFPGIIFAEIRAGSTIGGLVQEGDYSQEETSLLAGFQVMNAICTVGLLTKKFTIKEDSSDIVDTLNKYYFSTDLFQKNVPFRLLLTFAFETISKSFIAGSTSTHTLSSIILGTEVEVEITRFLNLIVILDSNIYTFGQDDLLGVDPGDDIGGFLFSVQIGVKLRVDRLLEKPEISE